MMLNFNTEILLFFFCVCGWKVLQWEIEEANITQGTHQFLIFHYLLLKRFYIYFQAPEEAFEHSHMCILFELIPFGNDYVWGKKAFEYFVEFVFNSHTKFYHPGNSSFLRGSSWLAGWLAVCLKTNFICVCMSDSDETI